MNKNVRAADSVDGLLDQATMASTPRDTAVQGAGSQVTLPIPGTEVDEYKIIDEIARGGMGVVYRAKHDELDRIVALKMVLETEGKSSELYQRFSNEAKAAAAIDHPGIVPVHDVGTWNGYPYFTMGYVDGDSLHAELRDGPLAANQAARIARDVARAIAAAQELNIVHRDLKPANILIDSDGEVHVTDFGVSKFLGQASDLTSHGEMVGTPHYMPPEQAGGKESSACFASDVYSIGAVLYASLTGRPPFQAATPVDVVSQVLTKDPVAPSALVGSTPVELDVVTLKCLAKLPNDRYPSAKELAADLDRFLNGEPIEARPPNLWQRSRLAVQRHVILASVSGTAVLFLLLLTALVVSLYVRGQSKLAEFKEQLETTQQQLEMERATVARFIRSELSQNNAAQFSRFEVTRLAEAALANESSNPDLALQLAIASSDVALAADLTPHPKIMDLIKRQLSILADSAGDAHKLETLKSTEQWLDYARERIEKPLTSDQSELYGLKAGKTVLGTNNKIDENTDE